MSLFLPAASTQPVGFVSPSTDTLPVALSPMGLMPDGSGIPTLTTQGRVGDSADDDGGAVSSISPFVPTDSPTPSATIVTSADPFNGLFASTTVFPFVWSSALPSSAWVDGAVYASTAAVDGSGGLWAAESNILIPSAAPSAVPGAQPDATLNCDPSTFPANEAGEAIVPEGCPSETPPFVPAENDGAVSSSGGESSDLRLNGVQAAMVGGEQETTTNTDVTVGPSEGLFKIGSLVVTPLILGVSVGVLLVASLGILGLVWRRRSMNREVNRAFGTAF